MRRELAAAVRGTILALVAITAMGESWHAHASVVHGTADPARVPGVDASTAIAVAGGIAQEAAPADVPAERAAPDLLDRRIERPLPFLAGQGTLESLLEISPRVSVRSNERVDGTGDDSDTHPGRLSQLRVRLATWQHAAIARALACACQGALHQFSTPPPVSNS